MQNRVSSKAVGPSSAPHPKHQFKANSESSLVCVFPRRSCVKMLVFICAACRLPAVRVEHSTVDMNVAGALKRPLMVQK